jgi:hypothetical protein
MASISPIERSPWASQTLIITGHLPDLPPGTGQRHRLLSKPAKPAELLAVVRDMMGEPPVSS